MSGVATGDRQQLLLAEEQLLNGEQAVEVDLTLPVLDLRHTFGFTRLVGALFPHLDLIGEVQVSNDGVFRFLVGLEHGLLVTGDQLLES